MFYVGQKVVCVDDDAPYPWPDGALEAPVKGAVYTITSVHTHRGNAVLWVREIRRSLIAIAQHGPDIGYFAWRFRPVVERKTDISIFKEILTNPHKQLEGV